MNKNCSICDNETNYPNNLCGPCYNVGLRGRELDGNFLVDEVRMLAMLKALSQYEIYGMVYEAIFKKQ